MAASSLLACLQEYELRPRGEKKQLSKSCFVVFCRFYVFSLFVNDLPIFAMVS